MGRLKVALDLRDESGSETVCAEFQLRADAVKCFPRTLSTSVVNTSRVELVCSICPSTDSEDAIGEFSKSSSLPSRDKGVVVVVKECYSEVEGASEYVVSCW